jgi:transcriptional regulator with XRE-family HTH domain
VLDREKELRLIAERIQRVRKGLKLKQTPFGERLGFDQTTISKWERGKSRPTPDALVRIAALAEGLDKLFFLTHAGLPDQYLMGEKMIPEMLEASHRIVQRALSDEPRSAIGVPEPAWVPLLKDAVAAGEPRNVRERDIADWIPFSKKQMPPGSDLRAVRASGDSMAPIINDGYIVVLDIAQRDPRRLAGQMVAAREGDDVTIKWLRKDKETYLLVPQHVSPRIPVRVMRTEDDWAIVGVVLKWIGSAPTPARR